MAPIDDFTSYEHYLVARQAVTENAVNRLTPTEDQKIILIIIGVYTAAIMILWNMPIAKIVLSPFKLLTVGLHEFSHAFVGCLTCAKIESIEIDPDEGGVTRMRGGIQMLTLPAGYLGSSLIGAILVMCGFNIMASKIASIFLGVCLLFTLWWAKNWLTRGIGILFIGVMIFLWWLAHGAGLKYFVLFVGVMSCLYCLWDILDDLVFRKVNESDASRFAKLCGSCMSSRVWGAFWFVISLIFFIAGILIGLVAFKEDQQTQQEQAQGFGW
ncbi:peptidase M50B-like-domain-containing protein [Helicostylum pulchrum]|uniref:Peptidase M50B-like-domain-containing protein n=1 Tax=Helicostylum pulchrum TaxID=562976 RepID=A0ABP9XPK2_9FUNG|nr:peptidase M50B-like-domain-containing protein [Helicostylum pulchrum]